MPVELSPIPARLDAMTPKERGNALSMANAVQRAQSQGWDGAVVTITVLLEDIERLPVLHLDAKSVAHLRITPLRGKHRADAAAMLYHDRNGVVWCIRLDGLGMPTLQPDLFQSWLRIMVLV